MNLYGRERRLLSKCLVGDRYLLKRAEQGKLSQFYDIGANVGIVSILCRLMHPECKIYAFEPFKQTYDRLVENVDNLKVKCNQLAYGNGEDFYCFKDRKTSLCNSFLKDTDCTLTWGKDRFGEKVKSFTLNEMLFTGCNSTCVKMDCEGAEHYLINDTRSTEKLKCVRWISIEVHEVNEKMSIKNFMHYIYKSFEETHEIDFYDNNGKAIQLRMVKK